jgi:hypothetical protein
MKPRPTIVGAGTHYTHMILRFVTIESTFETPVTETWSFWVDGLQVNVYGIDKEERHNPNWLWCSKTGQWGYLAKKQVILDDNICEIKSYLTQAWDHKVYTSDMNCAAFCFDIWDYTSTITSGRIEDCITITDFFLYHHVLFLFIYGFLFLFIIVFLVSELYLQLHVLYLCFMFLLLYPFTYLFVFIFIIIFVYAFACICACALACAFTTNFTLSFHLVLSAVASHRLVSQPTDRPTD